MRTTRVLVVLAVLAWTHAARAQPTSPAEEPPPEAAVPDAAVEDAPPTAESSPEPSTSEATTPDTVQTTVAPAEAAAETETEEKPWAFTAGLDLYSRFIWRGVSFGDQWTLQPNATFTTHGFGFYVWASAAPDQASLVDYVGLTVSYAYSGAFGTIGADLADWIFTQNYTPEGTVALGAPYLFDFDGNGDGSHWLDLTAYYIGPEVFPLKVQFGVIAYNDPDHSLYAGLSYPVDVGRGFTLTPELGMVFGESRRWYFTDDDPVNVTNCAVTLARTIDLGRSVTMPLSVALIVNPESERVHVVLGVGLRL